MRDRIEIMLCVSGTLIAETIKEDLKNKVSELVRTPRLGIIYIGSDSVIDNFIRYKETFGKDIGVAVETHQFDELIETEEVVSFIRENNNKFDGMIVQLPIPEHLDRRIILDAIPAKKDIDVLSEEGLSLFSEGRNSTFPPVAGAISEIVKNHDVDFRNKKIVLVGEGLLVGDPTKRWLEREGYTFDLVNLETEKSQKKQLLLGADVIISGVGSPHMITPDMIKEGVVLIDAGTSETGRKLRGDIHPDCMLKSSLFTPVPGGVGPITIAVLYRNIISGIIE